MAVRQLQYSQELEKRLARGETYAEAHKAATQKATVRKVTKPKKYDEEGLVTKVGRLLKMIYYGEEYPGFKPKGPTGRRKR